MKMSRGVMPGALILALAVPGGVVLAQSSGTQSPPEAAGQATPDEVAALRWSTAVVVVAERAPEARNRVPAATAVLERQEIEALPAASLAELIDYLPGFTVLSDEGTSGPPVVTARGFFGGGESGYVQLRIDGIPVADVEASLSDWNAVSSSSVERVEALRGAASSFYGDTALGGVVEVFTRRSRGNGELALFGGSLGEGGVDASASRRLGGVDAALRGSARLGPGARDHSDRDEIAGSLTLGLGEPERRWSFDAALTDRDREDPGPLSREELNRDRRQVNPAFRFDGEAKRKLRGALRFAGTWSRARLAAALWGSTRDSDTVRTLWLAPGLADSAARELAADALGATLDVERRYSAFGREGELRAGAELAREELESGYFQVGAAGERGEATASASVVRDRHAAFASLGLNATERLRLTAGLRWDRVVDEPRARAVVAATHAAWSPRAGLNLRLGDDAEPWALHLQLSRSFKVATLDQLYDPRPYPDFQGGSLRISNPGLDPQRARSYEIGISRQSRGLRWQAVAYRIDVDDEIDFDLASFGYANIVESRHSGLELEARLWPGAPLSPGLAYAWSRTEAASGPEAGHQLKNVPEHVVEPSLTAELPLGVRAELRLRLLAGRYLDDSNELPIPDSSVLDLRLSGRLGARLAWSLDALNLTDDERADYGFALGDGSGGAVPYFYPGARFALRARLEARF